MSDRKKATSPSVIISVSPNIKKNMLVLFLGEVVSVAHFAFLEYPLKVKLTINIKVKLTINQVIS